jgi:hypothetical protein
MRKKFLQIAKDAQNEVQNFEDGMVDLKQEIESYLDDVGGVFEYSKQNSDITVNFSPNNNPMKFSIRISRTPDKYFIIEHSNFAGEYSEPTAKLSSSKAIETIKIYIYLMIEKAARSTDINTGILSSPHYVSKRKL